MKLKLMYVVPHLSTGGMPQFVLKRIESLQKFKNEIEIYLVEYSQFSTIYLVQRNKIIELLGNNHFFSLGSFTEKERKIELINIIKKNNIDIVHFEEVPEGFESFNRVPLDVLNEIYNNSRTYKIVETSHNVWYNANENKRLNPDYYCFVTPYHVENLFNTKQSPKEVITYPLENKVDFLYYKNNLIKNEHKVPLVEKLQVREELGFDLTKTHILNVGLWTEGKNQKEGIEVARILEQTHPNLHFHFVGNQAENFENYWGPIMNNLPSNVTIWQEREDVDRFMIASDVLMFNSLIECNPLVVREAISYGLKILTRNLSQYMGMFDNYITEIESNNYQDISVKLLDLVNSKKTYTIEHEEDFGLQLYKFYNKVLKSNFVKNQKQEKNYNVTQHFVRNPFLEITGESDSTFEVSFIDNGSVIYKNNIQMNSWVKLNRQYFTNWETEIKENGSVVYTNKINLKNKRVFISFGSKSLGDTLAWIPYCEEFRLKHDCELIVSTFMNNLFFETYPNIKFVEPGEMVPNIYAQYELGWFYNQNGTYDENRHPSDFKLQPLQKTATDILGLNYEEIRPKLLLPNVKKDKKVGIGFHSTAQAKYWNNPNGWQEVVDYLNNLGYECVIYSKEGNGYMGNKYPKGVKVYKGGSLQDIINEFATCEFFVGLGSGLSWLAWACELPVVLISGFSEKWAETKLVTYRVINENVCHGCFNWDRLDAGDWNWCPQHKGTNRMFECSKQITSEMVIKEINQIIKDEDNNLITIVLAHANTEKKRNCLIESLKSIKTKVLLSTNHPIENDVKNLCDYINYETENPILLREEFDKYNSYFYFVVNEDGVEVPKYFDYEHGFAAYKLIFGGLELAKLQGFKKAHIINYDYSIDDDTLIKNNSLLDLYDGVFYKYKEKSYTQDSYSTGFISGKIEELYKIFSYYKTKDEYYSFDGHFKILEIITCDIVKKLNLNVKEFYYEDLTETCVLDSITDSHMFFEKKEINEFKKISDFYGCDKTLKHTYQRVYTKILENIRNEEFSLLEIGIDEGKSLNLWKDYLKNAKIYGLDINREFPHNRGYVFKGDQNKITDLQKIIFEIKSCKVIVDDGSHNPQHQVKTFNYLFENLLENGGYYIIEDIETSYWDPLSELYGYEIGYLNTVDYFTKLTHEINYNYNNKSNNLKIEFITFSPNCIIIKKLDY